MTNVPVPYAYNSERQRVKSLLTYLLCSSTLALLILQLLLLLLLLLWLRYLLLLVVHGHLESIEWVVGSSLFIALTQHCLDLLCASTQVHRRLQSLHCSHSTLPRPPVCLDTGPSVHRRSSYTAGPATGTRSSADRPHARRHHYCNTAL